MSSKSHRWVKPAPDKKIPFSRAGVTYVLPACGAKVPRHGSEGSFWIRRLAEGSVTETSESEVDSAKKKAAADKAALAKKTKKHRTTTGEPVDGGKNP